MGNGKGPLTHLNERGEAHMVDIAHKDITRRIAIARGTIRAKAETVKTIFENGLKKGDALAVARIAGIMGAKQTPSLIPLCHPVALSHVSVEITQLDDREILIEANAQTAGKTGVEMEALSAVSISALTLYDMAKSMDKDMVIGDIKLIEKSGGKSGHYTRKQ